MNRTMNLRRTRSHQGLAASLALPDRIVPLLGTLCAMLAGLYLILMVTTIFFATLQTKLAANIQDTRVSIERLESQYYAAIARIDATDPGSIGLVAPDRITYVTAARDTNLTFAAPARP